MCFLVKLLLKANSCCTQHDGGRRGADAVVDRRRPGANSEVLQRQPTAEGCSEGCLLNALRSMTAGTVERTPSWSEDGPAPVGRSGSRKSRTTSYTEAGGVPFVSSNPHLTHNSDDSVKGVVDLPQVSRHQVTPRLGGRGIRYSCSWVGLAHRFS